ncbi:MAG: ABC transporter permease subunit [Myxococcota bacterium]
MSTTEEATTAPAETPEARLTERPESLLQKRWRRFKSLKRGWYSFVILCVAFALSFLNPLLINNKALVVSYQGGLHFPVFEGHIEARDFGQRLIGEARYRELKTQFAEAGEGDFVWMPLYPFHPNEHLWDEPDLPGSPPHAPNASHWMGTDGQGRDVFARLVYGFRVSLLFGLSVLVISFSVGTAIGAALGYFGGTFDILAQRLIEIWSGLPFLYTIIIITALVQPDNWLLVMLLSAFSWMGITYYVRGEVYREKSRDYVAAAVAQGESHASIMFRHILPNSLTPIITFAPFRVVGFIGMLVALDYLGFGVPAPTASWGELVRQGLTRITEWHLVVFPLGAMFVTLIMVVFIGEAIREAFDPKVFSRLR